MHNETSMIAKPMNKVARYVFLGLIGTALLLVLVIYLGVPYTGILWTVDLVFITSALYVYNRHVASEYCYEVASYGGRESFIVSMRVGKTVRTLARLDADAITEVRRLTGKEYRDYKCSSGVYKYAYFPTMFPDSVYLVSIRSFHEKADVFIEANEEFASVLASFIQRHSEDIE